MGTMKNFLSLSLLLRCDIHAAKVILFVILTFVNAYSHVNTTMTQLQNTPTMPQNFLVSLQETFPPTSPSYPPIYCPFLWFYFPECPVHGIIEQVASWVRLLSLRIHIRDSSRLLYVNSPFPSSCITILSCGRVYSGLVHSSVEELRGYFQVLVIMNRLPNNSHAQVFVWA